MSNLMEKYLVRIENIGGHGVGAGFLINKMEVATCAHVVSTALGFGRRISFEAPQDEIHLTFPFIQKDVQLQAHVACWDHANDIAILRLKSVPPAAAESACFSGIKIYELRNHPVRMYGFPEGYNDGVWSNDWKIKDSVADNLVQLESDRSTGKPIGCGFSGAPVFDEQLNQVVGMIFATDSNIERKVAFMIPAEAIARVWPVLLEKMNTKLSRPEREICEEYLKASFHESNKDDLISICKSWFPSIGNDMSYSDPVKRLTNMFLDHCQTDVGFDKFFEMMKIKKPNRYDEFYSEWKISIHK